MMIAVESRNSRGESLTRVEIPPRFNPVLLGVDVERFPMLASIDPYGDTFFNYLQVKRLMAELDIYSEAAGPWGTFQQELKELCRQVLAKPHRFLRFVGD